MALELRQQLRLTQQLVMTPQLQLSIKLLQQSRLELTETIEQELKENPVLEVTADPERAARREAPEIRQADEPLPPTEPERPRELTADENATPGVETTEAFALTDEKLEGWEQYIQPSVKTASIFEGFGDDDGYTYEDFLTESETLQDHLLWQLEMSRMDDEARKLGRAILGNVDADGYFRMSREELIASLGAEWTEEEKAEIDPDFFGAVLERLQQFDPCGVCARDLRECLLLQLDPLGQDDTYVGDIVRSHLEDIEKRRIPNVLRALDITREELARALEIIQGLDPRPGRRYADSGNRYVTPDIYVHRVGDDYVVTLNDDGVPPLSINPRYREMARRGAGSLTEEERRYVNDHIRSATWLIKSIQQRQSTIQRVTEAIMHHQRAFLDRGIEHLRPLVLREIAAEVGMHESTVGRVTTNKYVQTPQGIFELKFFFTSAISSLDGENHSSQSVKVKIQKLIETENADKPLSDTALVNLLKRENIDIARRTVAKYREALDIAPSNRRRRLV